MRIIVLAALFLAAPAHAEGELYLDVGVGHMWGSTVVEQTTGKAWGDPAGASQPAAHFQDASGPHAAVEAGYKFGQTSVFVSHVSSISSGRDKGVNVVGVKHRFSVRVP